MLCTLFYIAIVAAVLYRVYRWHEWKQCKLDYSGKTVFITGGSSGIGEAFAKRIIDLGAKKVIIAARRQTELDRVKKECSKPELIQTFILDLNNPDECLKKCEELFAKEKIDILVNNGGCS